MRRFSVLFGLVPGRRRPLGDGARARIDILLRRGREREAVEVYRDETGHPWRTLGGPCTSSECDVKAKPPPGLDAEATNTGGRRLAAPRG